MLRLISFALFLIFYLSVALATPNLNFSSTALADDAPFNLSYKQADINFGKDLDLLFSELAKNELNKKSVLNLTKYFDKPHSFSIIIPVYDRLKKILTIKSQDDFYKNCSVSSTNLVNYTDDISDRFNLSIDKYCRNSFLKKLTELSSNINFSTRDLAYFNDATSFFINGESQPELILLLRHFKTNTIEHEKLSNLLIQKFIEYKIKPNSKLLTSLKVNPLFNKFLQNNLNLDDTSNSYFHDEFHRLTRLSSEAIEKNDFTLAKTLLHNAFNFYEHNKNFIDSHKAWNSIVKLGKSFYYKGKDSDAIEVFNLSRSIYSKEDFSESYFYLLWPHLINKNYKAMKDVVDKNDLEKNFEKFDSKLQYWIAATLCKNGDSKKGILYFNKIITNSPYSFYSILSLKELAILNNGLVSESDILAKFVSHDEPSDFKMDKASSKLTDALKRLAVWNKLGNERFSTLELRYIQFLSKDDTFKDPIFAKSVTPQDQKEFLTMNLIRLLNHQKKYITSFKIFQDSFEQNPLTLNYKLIKFIFPLAYIDLIKKNSDNIDPLIIISLIRQESAFNPEAKSGVGAKGLMQLMPATAKRFNKKVRVSHLGNPAINVAIGSKYLRVLLSRFDGNLIFALASYNAGENRIDRWRKDIFRNDDPLSTIESIPFEETRNYVKLIYRNNFFYSLISNKPALMIPLDESFKVKLSSKSL